MSREVPFELGPIRPVAEGRSLLIRTTRGCPWNKCEFCTSYHGYAFSIRTVAEILQDIRSAAEYYEGYPFESCFLQDGDSMLMKTADLLEVLKHLKEHFPNLKRITSYGRAATLARKSPEELKQICEAGINRVYCGMETGSDTILKMVNKGTTAADLVKSGKNAKAAGMEVSEFIILGLGGRELSRENALETARVLNEINPDFIRVRTIRVKPNTGMDRLRLSGSYTLQSEEEMIEEQKLLIENLDGVTSYVSNDHAMNLLFEVEGRLPEDREKLLATLNRYLQLPPEDKLAFNIGARLGYIRKLDGLKDPERKARALATAADYEKRYPGRMSEVENQLRIMNS